MNLQGINQIQTQTAKIQKETEAVKPSAPEVKTPEKAESDAGALKSYFLGTSAISFKGHSCTTSNFQVKKLKDVPCCCCGRPMLRSQDASQIQKAVASTSGDRLAATLKGYSQYMRSDEKVVGSILAEEAARTGCDVGTAMRATAGSVREKTTAYCQTLLSELTQMVNDTFGTEQNPMSSVIASAQKELQNGRGLDRSTFVEKLEKASGRIGEEKFGPLQDKAMNLPETFSHVQRIFDKYTSKKDEEIARRLFSTAMTTAEHIHPHSLGGPDHTSNYIAECAGCNNPRGNMSYAQWLKVHPEYPRKAQEHIEHVQARLINGELGQNYNDYPVDVRGSLSKESGGRMVLKVLNPDRIAELRRQRGTGQPIDIKAEIEKSEAEKAEKAKNK